MSDEMTPEYMSPEEAADFLKVHVNTIYVYLNLEENPLPSYKISSKNIRIKKDELVTWVENKFKREEIKWNINF